MWGFFLVEKVLISQFLSQTGGRRGLNLPVYPDALPLGHFHRRAVTATAASSAVFVLWACKRNTWKRRTQICQNMLTVSWPVLRDTHQYPPPDWLIFREESSSGLLKTVTAFLLTGLQNLTLAGDGKWQTSSFQCLLDRSQVIYWHTGFLFGRYNCAFPKCSTCIIVTRMSPKITRVTICKTFLIPISLSPWCYLPWL